MQVAPSGGQICPWVRCASGNVCFVVCGCFCLLVGYSVKYPGGRWVSSEQPRAGIPRSPPARSSAAARLIVKQPTIDIRLG